MIRERLHRLFEPLRKNGVLDVDEAIRRGRIHDVDGSTVRWLITNRNDEIQAQQISSGFYERAELEQLRRDVGACEVILDVGANIGNHAIYFANYFACRRLILVEPYGPAIRHLLANLALNYSSQFDLGFLGLAVGAEEGRATLIEPSRFNIGLTRIDTTAEGSVSIVTGDGIVGREAIDLIKIDAEGMELDVIDGLSQVLRHQRPALFVEVLDTNRDEFIGRMNRHRYRVLRESPAYDTQTNFTMIPQ